MENKASLIFLFSALLILSSYSIAQASDLKQSEVLSYLYKIKGLRNNTNIDRSQFNAGARFVNFKNGQGQYGPGLKENDRIERLPGQPDDVKIDQYGGYVTLDPSDGRAFYYYFVEAPHNKNSLPLLLWLNGGPGCSSLGFGAMEELGPFIVQSDGKTLKENKFSWNHAANLLFLESPAGVGFSYSNKTLGYIADGDSTTAIDNYLFLLNWLERFPEYQNREFYISGESYAGHYGPQLAQIILYNNRMANTTIINLKGIIVGNPAINEVTDMKGMYENLASQAIISDQTLHQVLKYCDFSPNSGNNKCDAAIDEAFHNINAINIYDIYAPKCTHSLTSKPYVTSAATIDPCIDDHVSLYLNRPEVQEALHANITKHIPFGWKPCSKRGYWTDRSSTILPLLKDLMANGIRLWLFSGDMDGRLPITTTKLAIKRMKLHPITSWLPWYQGDQVGGYTQVYEGNLTFATVRGAGHQVPTYQPARALSLIAHFLAGKELPKSKNNTIIPIP